MGKCEVELLTIHDQDRKIGLLIFLIEALSVSLTLLNNDLSLFFPLALLFTLLQINKLFLKPANNALLNFKGKLYANIF